MKAANRKKIVTALAGSLSRLDWNRPTIERHLLRRMPPSDAKLARKLADYLVKTFPKPFAPSCALLIEALMPLKAVDSLIKAIGKAPVTIAEDLNPQRFLPSRAFRDLGLPELATTAALAEHLALSDDLLVRFCDLRGLSNATDNPFAPHYRFHIIPKPSGGQRLIEEPKPLLKSLQRRILKTILDPIPAHPSAFGFVSGRSCVEGAARHAGERMVVSFDLKDYFPSITLNRPYGLFRSLGYPHSVARHLTGLTTLATPAHIIRQVPHYQHLSVRHLPQGAPTSPALANLCSYTLDRRLDGLARSIGANYSRYADDLTFSGDTHIAAVLRKAVPQITADEGFVLNPAKTRESPRHRRQQVTGITVNQHVNVPRIQYDKLKATIHNLGRDTDPGARDPHVLSQLSGRIAWVEQVNPHKGARLRDAFERLTHNL